jgi:ABC-type nitrate/sulfonate/bicarbonate transport system permease component
MSTPRALRSRWSPAAVAAVAGSLPLAVGLALWELLGSADNPYFPVPSEWVHALANAHGKGVLLPAFWATFETFVAAMAMALVVGTVVGGLIGASRRLDSTLSPTLEFLRVTPAPAVVPIAVVLIGYTSGMKILVVVLSAVWPLLLNMQSAVRDLNQNLLEVGKVLHLGRWRTLRKVIVPSLLPALVLGLRVSAPICLIVTLLVEFLTRMPGIGGVLSGAQQTFDASLQYGLLLLTAVMAIALNVVVTMAGKLVRTAS